MALTVLPSLVLKGALAAFHQKMETMPQIYRNYSMDVTSTTQTEKYSWPGVIPVPRVFENARSIQGFRDFDFDITNKTYELTILIDLEDFEDDQVGGINMRFLELAEVFGTFKDQLFAELLENGADATDGIPPINSADNISFPTFYDDTATVGDSATIDNDYTTGASGGPAGTRPTPNELSSALDDDKATMSKFEDDQGRPIFNAVARNQVRCVIPVEYEMVFREVMNTNFVMGDDTAGGSKANAFQGFTKFDTLPYLANADAFYMNFLGSVRKPFIFQNRTALQIEVDTDPKAMLERNGVLVLCRERFELTYGDPRRASRHVFT